MIQGMTYVNLSFTSLLQDTLGYVFDKVLSPVLRDTMNILINLASKLIQSILANFLLRIWITLLKLVDFLEKIFDVFSGISPVKVKGVSHNITLLEYFFEISAVQRAFVVITAIAVLVAFITTLISVCKSMSGSAFENKSPISFVLKQGIKAAVTFMIIPISCLFLLQLVTRLTVIISSNMVVESADTSMGDVLFMSVAQDAAKNNAVKEKYAAGQKYEDAAAVERDFNINRFSYVLAYASTALVALLMLCSILQFIQRIIVILLLYLVSPFFVAYMPLDGGGKFREWKNMFVAHMIAAFGPIIAMKLYFMVVPFMVQGNINYGNFDEYTFACMKLFIVMGGAFAIYKSRLLLLSVVNPSAAGAAAESGIIGSFVSGKVIGGFSKMGAGIKGGGRSGGSSGQYKPESQAYKGK